MSSFITKAEIEAKNEKSISVSFTIRIESSQDVKNTPSKEKMNEEL